MPDLIAIKDLVFKIKINDIWEWPEKTYAVMFDNGPLQLTKIQLVISWYYWRMYKVFPAAPRLLEVVVPKDFTSETHRIIGGFLVWTIKNNSPVDYNVWVISKVFYEVTNDLHNMCCLRLPEYVTSGSIHDLIEIIEEEEIAAAKAKYREIVETCNYNNFITPKEIAKVHKTVWSVLSNPVKLQGNDVKKLIMAGLVNKGQMLQLIGPRGYVTDVDGTPFPYPIDNGYFEGLTTLYDASIESRSASRAMMMTTAPLEDSEYLNRSIQLAATTILDYEHLGSCGCSGYVTVPYLVQAGDDLILRGKYYMKEGIPKLIWNNTSELEGTIIDIRTITGCGMENTQKVCNICLGWYTNIIPPETNLGYALATPINAKISQFMLSTKHYEGSSQTKTIELNSCSSKWFTVDNKNKDTLLFTDFAGKNTVIMRIDIRYVASLSQILHIDIDELPLSRITSMPVIGVTLADKEGNQIGPFDQLGLDVSGTGVYLTADVLSHLKLNGWDSGKGYVEFKLEKWGTTLPVFHIPKKSDSIMVFFKDVSGFLKAQTTSRSKITDYKTRAGALVELIAILRTRINDFNIVQAEILIRTLMVTSYPNASYRLPHPSQDFHFMDLDNVITNRSLTSLFAFENQHRNFLNISWHNSENLTEHMLDGILESD